MFYKKDSTQYNLIFKETEIIKLENVYFLFSKMGKFNSHIKSSLKTMYNMQRWAVMFVCNN